MYTFDCEDCRYAEFIGYKYANSDDPLPIDDTPIFDCILRDGCIYNKISLHQIALLSKLKLLQ